MININYPKINTYTPRRSQVAFKGSPVPMVKDVKLANLYATFIVGKVKLGQELFYVNQASNEFFSILKRGKSIGYIVLVPRMFEGKTCYSCSELRNLSNIKGVGTKLLQIGFKAHKDSGMTGDFRVHDVLYEAEDFYAKLGFKEDLKREQQWYLPKENEHILETYNGGL